VAEWEEGQNWQQVGAGLGNPEDEFAEVQVRALSVKDGVLYAGGEFVEGGDGTALNHVARFVGGAWRPLGSGARSTVEALHASNELVVGGQFVRAGETFSPYLAAHPATLSAFASTTVDSEGSVQFENTGVTIDFSGVSGSGPVTVRKFSAGPDGSDGISESNVSDYRFTIDVQGDLSFDSETEVRMAVSTLGGIDDATQVTMYQRSTVGMGLFTERSTSYDSGADELVASTGSFGEFVLASDSQPLPVELAGFEATVNGDAVRLSWSTASETRNASFQIQRRPVEPSRRDGSTGWKTVGVVEGSGTTSQAQSYRFADEDLPYEAERLTYRLRQVDTDGSAHLSETVTIERGVQELQLLGTHPNPARQRATVRYALPEKQETTIRLYDILGRRVRTVLNENREGRHERTLDVGALPSGVYFLRLRAGGETRTQKLTIVR
jgi:hypothetical protein